MKKLCLLLAGCLLFLAACSGNGNENGGGGGAENLGRPAGGRYVETEITPPIEGRFTTFLTADGTIVCFDDGLSARYESTDGGNTWSGMPGPVSGDRVPPQAGSLLPDGSLLAFVNDEGIVKITPDGTEEHFPVEEIDAIIAAGESIHMSLLRVLENDRLILNFFGFGGFMQQVAIPGGNDGGDNEDNDDGEDGDEDGDTGDEAPQMRIAGGTGVTRGGGGVRVGQGGGAAVSRDSSRNRMLLLELSTGQVIAEIPADNTGMAQGAVSDGSYIYILSADGTVSVYNLDDGSPSGRPDIAFRSTGGPGRTFGMMRMGASGSNMALGADGGLYVIEDGSLMLSDSDGVISTVLEGTAYSIGAPNNSAASLFVMDGFIVNVNSGNQGSRLYRYVWDENAAIDPDKDLTIWSLEDNSFVRAAIAELRKKHPDSFIRYEVALSGGGGLSASDAIRTLNTRLLGGNAPDILILDGCSVENYADRGLLLELSGIIDTGDVFSNLLTPFENNGQLFVLPAQFIIPLLMGSAEALDEAGTLEALVSLVVEGNDLPAGGMGRGSFEGIAESERSALYFQDLEELTNILWLSSAPTIINNNRLDSDALSRYLEAVKAISDKYGLAEEEQGGMSGMFSMMVSDGGRASAITGSLIRYTMQQTNYAAFFGGNLQIMQMMMDRAGSTLVLFPGLTPGVWQPSALAGISADTNTPEFAAEFLRTMLSLEVQQLNFGTGLPVTRGGFAAQIETINERSIEMDMNPLTFDIGGLVSGLQTPSMNDDILTDMIWVSVERLCKGEIDVEGAVRAIEQSISTYLAERS
jgi:ABC-type glycerol-3-phosphate transport system substrate-binding protein